MDELNPYQSAPIAETSDFLVDPQDVNANVSFTGGLPIVGVIGVAGGLLLLTLIMTLSQILDSVAILVAPLLSFTLSLALTYHLLNGSSATAVQRVKMAAVLSIPATVFFAAVCSASGTFFVFVIDRNLQLGMTFSVLGIAGITIACFVLVLVIFAILIRRRTRDTYLAQPSIAEVSSEGTADPLSEQQSSASS